MSFSGWSGALHNSDQLWHTLKSWVERLMQPSRPNLENY
jgi:hypothetical protein